MITVHLGPKKLTEVRMDLHIQKVADRMDEKRGAGQILSKSLKE